MTDLQMTRRCAERMGHEVATTVGDRPITTGKDNGLCCFAVHPIWGRGGLVYDPLHDDAQCFALVKRFKLSVGFSGGWGCVKNDERGMLLSGAYHYDTLNRAIVECCANMPSDGQEERHG